jgi:hypothetical protein
MRSILLDWEAELARWLKPFLDRLGHKARRRLLRRNARHGFHHAPPDGGKHGANHAMGAASPLPARAGVRALGITSSVWGKREIHGGSRRRSSKAIDVDRTGATTRRTGVSRAQVDRPAIHCASSQAGSYPSRRRQDFRFAFRRAARLPADEPGAGKTISRFTISGGMSSNNLARNWLGVSSHGIVVRS